MTIRTKNNILLIKGNLESFVDTNYGLSGPVVMLKIGDHQTIGKEIADFLELNQRPGEFEYLGDKRYFKMMFREITEQEYYKPE